MTKPLITYDPSRAWQEHLCTSPRFVCYKVERDSCSRCSLNTQKEKQPCPNCSCICTALRPKGTPRQWLVSFDTSCFPQCSWAALSLSDFPTSQRGYKSNPAYLKPLAAGEPESRGDFPALTCFLLTFQSTTFPWEKSKVIVFFPDSVHVLSHGQRRSSEMLPVLLKSLKSHCTTELGRVFNLSCSWSLSLPLQPKKLKTNILKDYTAYTSFTASLACTFDAMQPQKDKIQIQEAHNARATILRTSITNWWWINAIALHLFSSRPLKRIQVFHWLSGTNQHK